MNFIFINFIMNISNNHIMNPLSIIVVLILLISGCIATETPTIPISVLECEKEQTTLKKNLCLTNLAKSNLDEEICELIEYKNDGFQDGCYLEVATIKKDENICLKIKNNELENKDQCFSVVAIQKNDNSICDNIEIQRIKDLCFDKVERYGGNV